MFEKIKSLKDHSYFKQFRDVRSWTLAGFGVIAIMVTWSGIKSVQTNYGLQRQISKLQQQNDVADLENQNLKLKNEYLNTDQFLELAARRQLGKSAPGESVLIVPKSVALAHAVNLPDQSSQQKAKAAPNKPTYQKNFEAWVDFFLHRSNNH